MCTRTKTDTNRNYSTTRRSSSVETFMASVWLAELDSSSASDAMCATRCDTRCEERSHERDEIVDRDSLV